MNVKKKNCTPEKERFWLDRIADWKASALSQQEYCRRNELALATFGYWRRKLKPEESKPHFYPLALPPMTITQKQGGADGKLRLVLGADRFAIEVDDNFSEVALRRLVQALEQL